MVACSISIGRSAQSEEGESELGVAAAEWAGEGGGSVSEDAAWRVAAVLRCFVAALPSR